MKNVPQWTVFEAALEGFRSHTNPFWDVTIYVHFTSPLGKRQTVEAFWDGPGVESGDVWRVRFSPGEIGEWCWVSECAEDAQLHGCAGSFQCTPYSGDNPLYHYGPVRLADSRRHLVWGTTDAASPFFWLADTAWNGVLRADEADWDSYLRTRREQGFTVIQFVSTQWRGGQAALNGEVAFAGTARITLHPEFFQKRDAKVAAINDHGLIAAPVLLWALWESDPGQALSEEDAIRLCRYLVARWGAYQVIWLLGGDGNYKDERADHWQRIGAAVFGPEKERLVTLHPCGQSWVGPEFRGQPWFDFIGYQSGHGSSEEHLRWLVQGPPATDWATAPALPVINLEPNYEFHPSYHGGRIFGDYEVRRAAYWSLLLAPPAGVTYGNNPIWTWTLGAIPEAPEGHASLGPVAPWHTGVETPGVRSMSLLRQFFERLPWWQLEPAPELLTGQPGKEDPARFIAAAKTADGACAVIYIPQGGDVCLDTTSLVHPAVEHWFNPRTGLWTEAGPIAGTTCTLTSPEEQDWVLCIYGK